MQNLNGFIARTVYKTFKNKELKSGLGTVVWRSILQQLDRIWGTNPKSKGLEESRDTCKKDSQSGLDLNEDPPELVEEMKKKTTLKTK